MKRIKYKIYRYMVTYETNNTKKCSLVELKNKFKYWNYDELMRILREDIGGDNVVVLNVVFLGNRA